MQFFNRLRLAFSYGPELDKVLADVRAAKLAEEARKKIHNLNLCEKHQQRNTGSCYSEHNCDHCRLEAEVEELRKKHNA